MSALPLQLRCVRPRARGPSPQPTSTPAFQAPRPASRNRSPASRPCPIRCRPRNLVRRKSRCWAAILLSTRCPFGRIVRRARPERPSTLPSPPRDLPPALMPPRPGKPTRPSTAMAALAGGHPPAREVGGSKPAGGAGGAANAQHLPRYRPGGPPGDGQSKYLAASDPPRGNEVNPASALIMPSLMDAGAVVWPSSRFRDQPGKTMR